VREARDLQRQRFAGWLKLMSLTSCPDSERTGGIGGGEAEIASSA